MGGWFNRWFGRFRPGGGGPKEGGGLSRRELDRLIREAFELAPRCDAVPGASGRFGYEDTSPIPVCRKKGELDYLERLRCSCGKPFFFHRAGSCGSGPDGHILDAYELACQDRHFDTTLFFDMYHAGPSARLPEGLTQGEPAGVGVAYRVERFPEDLEPASGPRPE
ncbi:MAG: hypothetical protein ACOYXN_11140 [Acidobacteriota bacterium]